MLLLNKTDSQMLLKVKQYQQTKRLGFGYLSYDLKMMLLQLLILTV
jgi:hypothetical protein